jgi:hypothetical protein
MPTGYTADIEKGITFKQFALSCARAFGACVTMRDESQSTPIPDEFEPNDWNLKELHNAEKRLAYLEGLTELEADRLSEGDYTKLTTERKDYLKNNQNQIAKYRNMLVQVKAWQPPTPDHVELKNFMIQQIESSIKFDDMQSYYAENTISKLTGKQWLQQEIAKSQRDIEYHQEEYVKEVGRTAIRNKWLKDLRVSLEVKQNENCN